MKRSNPILFDAGHLYCELSFLMDDLQHEKVLPINWCSDVIAILDELVAIMSALRGRNTVAVNKRLTSHVREALGMIQQKLEARNVARFPTKQTPVSRYHYEASKPVSKYPDRQAGTAPDSFRSR